MIKRKRSEKTEEAEKPENVMCYVCDEKIPKGREVYLGQETYRCKRCVPGSARWLKNQTQSKTGEYYKKGDKDG